MGGGHSVLNWIKVAVLCSHQCMPWNIFLIKVFYNFWYLKHQILTNICSEGYPKYYWRNWNFLLFSNTISSITLTCQIIVQQILLFFREKNTYTTLLGPTCLLTSEIFPSKPDFHLHKWEKNPSYTALLRPTRLLIS